MDRKFNVKAVVIGWLVGFIGSLIPPTLVVVGFSISWASKGVKEEQISAHMESLSASTPFVVGFLVVGFCGSVLGGLIAAQIAKQSPVKHAAATGVLSLLVGMLAAATSSSSVGDSVWDDVAFYAFYLLTVPFAMLGGYLRTGTKRSDTTRQSHAPRAPIPHP